MTAIAIATLGTGVLIFLLSLPLIGRKVPMNRGYGIRIRAAFESEQRWYDINAYGGRQLAGWSWLIIAAGIAGFVVPSEHEEAYVFASVGVTLFAVLMPALLVCRWSRKK